MTKWPIGPVEGREPGTLGSAWNTSQKKIINGFANYAEPKRRDRKRWKMKRADVLAFTEELKKKAPK